MRLFFYLASLLTLNYLNKNRMLEQNTHSASNQTFHIDEYGILHLKLYGESKYNLLTVKKLNTYISTISNICDKSATSILIDLRNVLGVISIDSSCYWLLAEDLRLKSVCSKIAFITNSLSLKLKIDKYNSIYHPKVETRVFNNVGDGISYCRNS